MPTNTPNKQAPARRPWPPRAPRVLATCSAAPVGPEMGAARVENGPEHAEHRPSAWGCPERCRGAPPVDFPCRSSVRARTTTACWASRRCILGVLAIQRVDGPSLAMLTHPSNQSFSLGQIRPGPSSCRARHLAGVFFATPRRVLVRAATRITRLRGPPWDRHSGTTPRSGGGAAGSRIP